MTGVQLHKDVFTNHYSALCTTLTDIDSLLPFFVAKKIITINDQTIIKGQTGTLNKVTALLPHISGPLDAGNSEGFQIMLTIMNEHGHQATKNLAEKMCKEANINTRNDGSDGLLRGTQQQQQAAPPESDPMNDKPFVNDRNMTKQDLIDEYTEKSKKIKPLGDVKTKDKLSQTVAKLEDYEHLIEVVNDIEFYTVICEMEGEIYSCIVCDDFTEVDTTYYYGKWKKVPIVVVQTAKHDAAQFQFGSWFATKKALYYMPWIKYVFGVGVCGAAVDVDDLGIEKPRVPKGHVVVSKYIQGYDHQKKAEHDESRSYVIPCGQYKFYNFLNQTEPKHKWDKGLKFGRVLSGSWLIANIEVQKSLLNCYQKDEIAFEMEGIGIAAACQNNKNVECCLVIKGVSDYANRQKNDGWQPAAARNAARYLSDMINKKKFPVDNEP